MSFVNKIVAALDAYWNGSKWKVTVTLYYMYDGWGESDSVTVEYVVHADNQTGAVQRAFGEASHEYDDSWYGATVESVVQQRCCEGGG